MPRIDFEDAIAELLDQIYSAIQEEEDFATARLQCKIVATNRSSLRLVSALSEAQLLENASK